MVQDWSLSGLGYGYIAFFERGAGKLLVNAFRDKKRYLLDICSTTEPSA
jgi:hypothetical protein